MLGRQDSMETGCDMPHCYANFDKANGRKVALLSGDDGKTIMAFCREHCRQLKDEGVTLMTLDQAQSIRDGVAEEKERLRQRNIFVLVEQRKFIKSLKIK